jgi:hypothetical protein
MIHRQYYRKVLPWVTTIVTILVVLVVLGLRQAKAATGINHLISFQGKVVATAGTNVANGSYTFVFSIYSVSSAGSPIWTETKSITTIDGLFQTDLGSVTALPGSLDFNTDNLYLGINFNGDGEMTPRVRFDSVPQAFNSERVNGLTVTASSGTLTIPNSKTISFADAFTTSGAFPMTLVAGASTTATFPTGTITLADLATAQSMSNKTFTASTWNGNAVGAQYGGTGQTTYTTGDLLYASNSTTLSKLGIGSNGNCLVLASGLPSWTTCGGSSSLQSSYGTGNTITTTDARDLSFTLAHTATDSNFLVNIATGSVGKFAVQSNGTDVFKVTGTTTTIVSGGLTATGNSTIAGTLSGLTGLTIASGGATLTTGNLTVSSGSATVSGLITGNAGLTVTGAAVNLNASSNFAINIGTGTTNAGVAIGGASNTVAITSTGLNLTTAGALTGLTGIAMASGNLLQTGNGTFGTGTGAVSLNGDVTIATNKGLTFTSGTGTIVQNYSNTTGTAHALNITDSASSSSTSTIGQSIAIVGTDNAGGSNAITGLSFPNVTAHTNNTYYGVAFGTGLTDLLRYNSTQLISGTGVAQNAMFSGAYSNITGVGTLTSLTISGVLSAQTAASGLVLGTGAGATSLTSTATSARAISFPDAAGTLALTISNVTSATNLAGGSAGNIPYQSGAGATAFVGGSTGQLLTSNNTSAPTFGNIQGMLTAGTNIGSITGTTNATINVSNTPTFTGLTTISGTGANELAITGAPSASGSSSLVRIGNATSGGNSNGTYLGLNTPSTTADLINLQNQNVSGFLLSSTLQSSFGATAISGARVTSSSNCLTIGGSSCAVGLGGPSVPTRYAYYASVEDVGGNGGGTGFASALTVPGNGAAYGNVVTSPAGATGGGYEYAYYANLQATGLNDNYGLYITGATSGNYLKEKLIVGATLTNNADILSVTSTSAQARFYYDTSHYTDLSTNSSGALTVTNQAGYTFTGGLLTVSSGGVTLTAGNLTVSSGTITSSGTINSATISGGSLSASAVNGLSVSGGTVSVGTWQGTAIAAVNGGTGQTAYTSGDLLYASGTTVVSKLAVGSNGNCLIVASALPSWGSCSGAAATLQSGYDATSGNTITTTDARDLLVTLPNTSTDPNFTVNIATNSTGKFAVQSNATDVFKVLSGPGTSTTDSMVQLGSAQVSGSSAGTYLSINSGVGYTGNFLNVQLNGSDRFKVDSAGNITAAGTVNGITMTNNGTNTLNIAAGKTLAVSNSLTFTGTDSTSFAFPSTSDTVVTLAAAQILTNKNIGSTGLVFNSATNNIDTAAATPLVIQGRAASTFQTTSGNITLQPAGASTTANVQIGVGGAGSVTPDLLVLDASTSATDPQALLGLHITMLLHKETVVMTVRLGMIVLGLTLPLVNLVGGHQSVLRQLRSPT